MKVLISVDMEGVSGIVHTSETNPDRYDYERGRALMTAEANAVIAACPGRRARCRCQGRRCARAVP